MSAQPLAPVATALAAAAPTRRSRRHLLRIYRLEAWYELVKMVRLPAYSLPTLAFPVLFYILFATTTGGQSIGPASIAAILFAGYAAFGVIGAALFGFGVGVAVERGQGWLLLKRASPMPVGAYFAAKVFMSLLFGTAIVALLSLSAAGIAGVRMSAGSWLGLAATVIPGALPFCAMGLAFGTWVGPNAAPAVVNLVYLPMSFASGLWMPIQMLPDLVQRVAPFLPPYHLGQLALKVVGADVGQPVWVHVAALAATTAVCLVLAKLGWRRAQDA